jgi:hypothetical protein
MLCRCCNRGSHAVAQRWSNGSDLPGSAGASPAVSCASRDTFPVLAGALCRWHAEEVFGGAPKTAPNASGRSRGRRVRHFDLLVRRSLAKRNRRGGTTAPFMKMNAPFVADAAGATQRHHTRGEPTTSFSVGDAICLAKAWQSKKIRRCVKYACWWWKIMLQQWAA